MKYVFAVPSFQHVKKRVQDVESSVGKCVVQLCKRHEFLVKVHHVKLVKAASWTLQLSVHSPVMEDLGGVKLV